MATEKDALLEFTGGLKGATRRRSARGARMRTVAFLRGRTRVAIDTS